MTVTNDQRVIDTHDATLRLEALRFAMAYAEGTPSRDVVETAKTYYAFLTEKAVG